MSVYHAPVDRAIIGPPSLTCVDLDGTQVPLTELWHGPSEAIDPTDPACWPEWTDNFYWETDPADVAGLEAAECERLADLHDAPDAAWHRMMAESIPAIAGGAPEFTPSEQDWKDYVEWTTEVERLDAERLEEDAKFPLYGYE